MPEGTAGLQTGTAERSEPEGLDARPTQRPTAAFLVIGNEILSGKVADTNTGLLARLLRKKGIALQRVVTIPDEPEVIAAETAQLSASHDFLFTSGRRGRHPRRRDHGRHRPRVRGPRVVHHPRFLESLRQRGLGEEATGTSPAFRKAPSSREGQSGAWPVVVMRNVWILPGLPPVFERKLEILADCLPEGPRYFADEELVPRPEEQLIPLLDRVVAAYPEVQIGSYPVPAGTRITLDGDDGQAVRERRRRAPAQGSRRVVAATGPHRDPVAEWAWNAGLQTGTRGAPRRARRNSRAA